MTNRMTAAGLEAFRKAEGDTRAPRRSRELPIHLAILDLLAHALPADAIWHHSPNELDMAGPEAARQVAKARKLGTRPGWPDIEIIYQRRAHFMEVKAPGGKVSPDQLRCHEDLERAGARVAVVMSVDDAQAILKSWGLI